MGSMKRVRLLVLLVIAVAFLAGAPARAEKVRWTALTPTGAEPGATGAYCVQHIRWAGPNYYGDVTVRCAGLAREATYIAVVWEFDAWRGFFPAGSGTFVTTKQGAGQVTVADVLFLWDSSWYVEVRTVPDDTVVLTE
jgi:hypothetical protein